MSVYQQQRQYVRKSIVETSVLLFETRGYEQTSVAAITQEVGIAKGTFYNHFEKK
ncbi:MAG: TetR/AcrR family transcriptional regulator [Bacillota bacterium]|nr:TetR/AcrR family transcriptional regulator [Bacillota bacterium]MDW7678294.1 TetR/AcrR family transcriptional regulator [Bacillota bacterium]